MRELVDKQLMLEDAKSWVAMDSYDQHWINNMSAWIKNLPTVEVSDGECISRRAAIDAIMGQPPEPHYPSWYAAQIEKLPAVQPERKQGEWIVWGGMDIPENHGRHKCSLCGEFAPVRYEKPLIKEYLSDFCPSCGADMRGEGNG